MCQIRLILVADSSKKGSKELSTHRKDPTQTAAVGGNIECNKAALPQKARAFCTPTHTSLQQLTWMLSLYSSCPNMPCLRYITRVLLHKIISSIDSSKPVGAISMPVENNNRRACATVLSRTCMSSEHKGER